MSINYSFLYITIKRASNFLFDKGAANNCEINKNEIESIGHVRHWKH